LIILKTLLFYSLHSCCIFCLQCFDIVGWVQEGHPACKKEWWVAGVAMCRFAYSPYHATWTTRVSRYQKKHSPTHPTVVIKCPLSASFICKDPWHTPCSIHMLDSLFHCLSPSFLWSTSWPDTLHFILQFFIQSLSSFCIPLMYIYLFCCSTEIMSFNPRLFQPFTLNSVLVSCHIFI